MVAKNQIKLFMKSKLILFFFCFISMNIYAQGGTIKGKVIDAKDSLVLIGANVVVLNTKLGAATDINGDYKISSITPGTYTIKISFVGYTPILKEGIEIKSSDTLTLNFELEWDYNSTVDIIQEKPFYFKIVPSCGPPWSADMIPIKEYYYLNMLDSLKQNPPELKPVVVEPPRIKN